MDVLNCTLKQNNIFLIDLFLHSFFFNLSHWLSLCWLNERVEEALNLHCIPDIFHLHLHHLATLGLCDPPADVVLLHEGM